MARLGAHRAVGKRVRIPAGSALLCLCCAWLSACAGSSVHEGPPGPLDGGEQTAEGGPVAADAGQAIPDGGQPAEDVGPAACSSGRTRCGDECVSLYVDPDHCGRCDNACPGTECLDGVCDAPGPCKKTGQSCSGGGECCEGLICGYYGSSLACKPPDA